jgi:hypothetical protein
MKIPIEKLILSIVMIAICAGLASSCKNNEEVVDRTCKVAFIQNLTNASGDTIFIDAIAGSLVQNVPILSRTGFNFDGWYTNAADANPDPNKTPKVPKFPAYDVSQKPIYLDVILYARWIK